MLNRNKGKEQLPSPRLLSRTLDWARARERRDASTSWQRSDPSAQPPRIPAERGPLRLHREQSAVNTKICKQVEVAEKAKSCTLHEASCRPALQLSLAFTS